MVAYSLRLLARQDCQNWALKKPPVLQLVIFHVIWMIQAEGFYTVMENNTMKIDLYDTILDAPIIGAVKNEESLNSCL